MGTGKIVEYIAHIERKHMYYITCVSNPILDPQCKNFRNYRNSLNTVFGVLFSFCLKVATLREISEQHICDWSESKHALTETIILGAIISCTGS